MPTITTNFSAGEASAIRCLTFTAVGRSRRRAP
jgi:hypothetical protein